MDEARAAAARGVPHGTTVLAHQQRAGRGRTGARWDSPAGAGLYATTVLYVNEGAALGGLSPVWALACAEGLGDVGVQVQLKWPNDLWVDGHKLAGLLLQREPLGPTGCCVLVGLGVNLTAASLQAEGSQAADAPPRTCLAVVRKAGPLAAEPLLAALLTRCAPAYAAWHARGLDAPMRARYNARHALHGLEVCGEGRHGPVRGTVAGLQACGGLLLHTPQGPQLVQAGTIAKVRPVGQDGRQNVAT